MKLTAYDMGKRLPDNAPRRGWGGGRAWIGKKTRAGLCRQAGLHPRALNQWRTRHPGSPLTDEQVIERIIENKQRLRK